MTDPKDELGARFNERRADSEDDETNSPSGTDDIDNSDNTGNSDNTNNTNNSNDTNDSDNPNDSNNSSNTGNKPGPNKDETATRHRRQVPMYLPDKKANELNKLYERLDGRSKVAGEGAIEKHADFMEALVEFVTDNEEDLAERLDISD